MMNEKYKIPKLIIQGKVEGRRGRRRPRITWIQNMREWTNLITVDLFWITQNNEDWNIMKTNVH